MAQNAEDVVLHRALGTVFEGSYIDVGANHPTRDSVSRAFYDRGWSGLLVEPLPQFTKLLRAARPRDLVAPMVAAAEPGIAILHLIENTGLSTVVDEVARAHESDGRRVIDTEVSQERLSTLLSVHGFDDRPIHFLSIDTEGFERDVLLGLDLTRHRPWVIVVEATAPNTTRQVHREWDYLLVDAQYRFCLFDGLSRFYVAEEHAETLGPALSYPACVFDDYRRYEDVFAEDHALALFEECERTLESNRRDLEEGRGNLDASERELDRMRSALRSTLNTRSWKATASLRRLRRLQRRIWTRLPGRRLPG